MLNHNISETLPVIPAKSEDVPSLSTQSAFCGGLSSAHNRAPSCCSFPIPKPVKGVGGGRERPSSMSTSGLGPDTYLQSGLPNPTLGRWCCFGFVVICDQTKQQELYDKIINYLHLPQKTVGGD